MRPIEIGLAFAQKRRLWFAIGLCALVGACATADSTVDAYDRTQERATAPVLKGEQVIEDAGAKVTGTDPAYQRGGTFFVNPDDDRGAFGTD